MKKFLALGLSGCAAAVGLTACGDSPENGRATAIKISNSIVKVCGAQEGSGNVGPRTITPIDLDGTDGPTGYLVTCVNGKTDYVEAQK